MITLEAILATLYRTSGQVYSCHNKKEYKVTLQGVNFTFYGPANGGIIVPNYNPATEYYYMIVAALLLDQFDILVDEDIQIGSRIFNRAKIWKQYEYFCDNLVAVATNNANMIPKEVFESRFIGTGESAWDSLTDYLESMDNIDHYDIAEYITPTFKQRLEAELGQRGLIVGITPTPSLF